MFEKNNKSTFIKFLLRKCVFYFLRIITLVLGIVLSTFLISCLILVIIIYSNDKLEIKDDDFHLSYLINWYYGYDISFSSFIIDIAENNFLKLEINDLFSNENIDGNELSIKKVILSLDSQSLYSGKFHISKLYLENPNIEFRLENFGNNGYLKDNYIKNYLYKYLLDSDQLNLVNGKLQIKNIENRSNYQFSNINLSTTYQDGKSELVGQFVLEDLISKFNSTQFKIKIVDNNNSLETEVNFISLNPSLPVLEIIDISELKYFDIPFSGKLNFLIKNRKVEKIKYLVYSNSGSIKLPKHFLENNFIDFYETFIIKNLKSKGSFELYSRKINVDELNFEVFNSSSNNYENVSISGSCYEDINDNFITKIFFKNFKFLNVYRFKKEELNFINNIPFSGNTEFVLNNNKISSLSLNLHLHEKNMIFLPNSFFNDFESILLTDAEIAITGDLEANIVNFNKFNLSFKNKDNTVSELSLLGKITNIDDNPLFNASINISNLNFLSTVYNSKNFLNPKLNDWLLQHVEQGDISEVKINFIFYLHNILNNDFPNESYDLSLELNNLGLVLPNFNDVIISEKTYLNYKNSKILLRSPLSKTDKLKFKNITFSHSFEDTYAKLDFKIDGQLADIVDFSKKNNIYILDKNIFNVINGSAELDIGIKFSLEEKFNLKNIERRIKGNIYNTELKTSYLSLFSDFDTVKNINFSIYIDDNYLNIFGSASTENIYFESKIFRSNSKLLNLQFDFILNDEDRKKLGISYDNILGNTEVNILLKEFNGGWNLKTTVDLKNSEVIIPELKYIKAADLPGVIYMNTNLDKDFSFKTLNFLCVDDLLNLEGTVEIDQDKNDYNIAIRKFKYLENEFEADIFYSLGKKLIINAVGKKLSVPLDLLGDEKYSGDLSIFFNINVDELYLSEKYKLYSASLSYNTDQLGVKKLDLEASYENDQFIVLNISRAKNYDSSVNSYSLTATDAGKFFSLLGYSDVITAGYYGNLGEENDIMGTISIDEFILKEAPIFAEILLAASLTGFFDLLTAEGIPFEQYDAQFIGKNDRYIIKKSRASGFSLGFTAVGWVDRNNQTLDIGGTIVPAYTINSIFNNIPIIGELFTGREDEGVIGVNFRMRGEWEDIDSSINPLSVLTPGLLRRMFDFMDRPVTE